MDYLYDDGGDCTFMNPGSFEQLAIPSSTIGRKPRSCSPRCA